MTFNTTNKYTQYTVSPRIYCYSRPREKLSISLNGECLPNNNKQYYAKAH